MLTAIVMVCNMLVKDDCMQYTDRRGPYATEQQCFARVEEMIEAIKPTLPPVPSQFLYKCADLKKGVAT